VSTAIASDPTVPLLGGRHHFLLRRLHSLTGLVFSGYLVVHLLINATLIEGSRHGMDVYAVQVNKIHELPFLTAVEWLLIYLPILYHTFYGIYITVTGKPNLGHYPYEKNWFYTLQRISAIVIVLFMAFHVFGMKGLLGSRLAFSPAYATQSAVYHMQRSWVIPWVIYPLGILASCYHLANGFWTAAITWGLTISAASQKRWGYVCAGLFVLTFACGLIALYALVRAAQVTSTPWLTH
jgi:succinate dehydrogenase / fumarate reductase, cytochrome b subunit